MKGSVATVWAAQESFVRRTLVHLGVRPVDVDDVAQDVARGVARGIAAFKPGEDPDEALRSWLYRMCVLLSAGYNRSTIRRRSVELLAEGDLPDVEAPGPGTEERLLTCEEAAELREMVAALAPERRAVIAAYEVEGVPMQEVAAALGIPLNTAWNRHRLAREDLRAAWRRRGLVER